MVLDILCQQLGDICQLEGACAPLGLLVGEFAFASPIVGSIYPKQIYVIHRPDWVKNSSHI